MDRVTKIFKREKFIPYQQSLATQQLCRIGRIEADKEIETISTSIY